MILSHKLNLLENAIDSLEESIEYYNSAVDNESQYKFTVLLFHHFVELIFKYFVSNENPLLCFVKPATQNVYSTGKTITLNDVIQILKNANFDIDKNITFQIKHLTNIRNKITHYEFEYKTDTIRDCIVNIFSGIENLYKTILDKDIKDKLSEEAVRLLDDIRDEFHRKVHLAETKAEELHGGEISECPECGAMTWFAETEYCYLCEKTIKKEIECSGCGELVKRDYIDVSFINDDCDLVNICASCYYRYMKD